MQRHTYSGNTNFVAYKETQLWARNVPPQVQSIPPFIKTSPFMRWCLPLMTSLPEVLFSMPESDDSEVFVLWLVEPLVSLSLASHPASPVAVLCTTKFAGSKSVNGNLTIFCDLTQRPLRNWNRFKWMICKKLTET